MQTLLGWIGGADRSVCVCVFRRRSSMTVSYLLARNRSGPEGCNWFNSHWFSRDQRSLISLAMFHRWLEACTCDWKWELCTEVSSSSWRTVPFTLWGRLQNMSREPVLQVLRLGPWRWDDPLMACCDLVISVVFTFIELFLFVLNFQSLTYETPLGNSRFPLGFVGP